MQLSQQLQPYIGDLLTSFIEYVPTLLLAIFILVLGWVVGKLVASLFQKLATRFGLEDVFKRSGFTDSLKKAKIERTITEMIGSLLFWIIFLNFLLITLETLGLDAAVEPMQQFIAFLPKLLVAAGTLIGGALLAQFVGKATQAAMVSMGVDFHEQLGKLVTALVLIIIIIIVVGQLGYPSAILNDTFITLLTIGTAGVALAFGLGGREIARSILAGYYARDVFQPGDTLEIDGATGTLEAIGTLNSELAVDGKIIVIPNTRLTEGAVTVHHRAEH
jgi:hypothetical protein